jgi:ADP-heptose:LPS heptosyltransferase
MSISPARRNAVVALAAGSPFKVGYLSNRSSFTPFLENTTVEAFGFVLEKAASYGRENIRERPLKVCDALSIPRSSEPFRLTLRSEIAASISDQLRNWHRLPSSDYLVVHPFSGWEFRSWGIDRFGILVERVITLLKCDVIIIYTQQESLKVEPLKQKFARNGEVHFFPSGNILETAVLLKNATLFIGNDSGPLHLAAALGTPIVGFYGPADPALTAPDTRRGSYIYKRVECSPCDQRRCVRPSDPCINLTTPDEVLDVVVDLIGPNFLRPTADHG